MYTILGAAADGRTYQFPRLLGLTAPIGELSSDTLVTAYDPATQGSWTVAGIKNDPEWPDYTFDKLRPEDPAGEDNFILTDVPNNEYELVWKWLRSSLPLNDGLGFGVDWRWRKGVLDNVAPIGHLPDSDADVNGNYPVMNAENWLRYDIVEHRFKDFDRWRNVYLVSDSPDVCYIEDQYTENDKVGRTGVPTPGYSLENPPGTFLLGLVDPLHVEDGLVKWTRLQR